MKKTVFIFAIFFLSMMGFLGHAGEFDQHTSKTKLVDGLLAQHDYDQYIKSLRAIFRLGEKMVPSLLSRLENVLGSEGPISNELTPLIGALSLLGDEGPSGLINLLSEHPRGKSLPAAIEKSCHQVSNVNDSRCKVYLEGTSRERIRINAIANRSESLSSLEERLNSLEVLSPKEWPNPQRDFDMSVRRLEGTINWIKRGGPKLTQVPGMSDEDTIRHLIIEFLETIEGYTPWLILPDTEKGKSVKRDHRVSYFHFDKKSHDDSRSLLSLLPQKFSLTMGKVANEIANQEKMFPMNLIIDSLTFSPDHSRALVLVQLQPYHLPQIDGFTFSFLKIEGQWQFRYVHGYLRMIA